MAVHQDNSVHTSSNQPLLDPVQVQAQEWIAARNAQVILEREWQRAERQLNAKVGRPGLDVAHAPEGELPEARTMRDLMLQIEAADRHLDRAARAIVEMRPVSPGGALAKIELGLRMQPQCGLEGPQAALIRDGVEQLRALLQCD